MKRTLIVTVLAALVVSVPAKAEPLNTTVPKVLTAERGAKARKGLGLPSYAQILGRKWKSKVTRADARIVAKLAPQAKTAALTPNDPDPLKASDVLRHGAERQKRTFRIATALDGMCPTFSADPKLATLYTVTGRAEHVVATVERVRGYDITTIVTLDLQIKATAATHSDATVNDPVASYGQLSLVRQQAARNRKTGKVKPTGPTQRYTGSIGPLFDVETGFEEFIDRYGDEDESPAPRRPLRSAAWSTIAQQFVVVLYSAMEADLKRAEAYMRTPNACVTLDVPHPDRLTPSQQVDLVGHPRLRNTTKIPPQLLTDTRIAGYLVNEQGQKAFSPATYPLDPGETWYRFTAPPKKWPETRPVGMDIEITTEGGIAGARVLFKPADGFPVRYKVLSASFHTLASGSADSILCGTQSGTREFTGGGTISAAASAPELRVNSLGGVDGEVWAKVPAKWHDQTTTACKFDDGGHKIPCTYNAPDETPRPDGTWTTGFSIRAPTSKADETATLNWAIPDPEIGYIDAGNDECYTSFAQHLDLTDEQTKVPLSKLLSSDPQTYTISGTRHWPTTSLGYPASIDYSWTYSMTLQRIP